MNIYTQTHELAFKTSRAEDLRRAERRALLAESRKEQPLLRPHRRTR